MTESSFDLTGRTALVTGGSKGIGAAIARGFAGAGADLFLCARSEGPLKATAEAIRDETGRKVEYPAADMDLRAELDRVARESDDRLGRIDILVNNAGWNVPQASDEIRDQDAQSGVKPPHSKVGFPTG